MGYLISIPKFFRVYVGSVKRHVHSHGHKMQKLVAPTQKKTRKNAIVEYLKNAVVEYLDYQNKTRENALGEYLDY